MIVCSRERRFNLHIQYDQFVIYIVFHKYALYSLWESAECKYGILYGESSETAYSRAFSNVVLNKVFSDQVMINTLVSA